MQYPTLQVKTKRSNHFPLIPPLSNSLFYPKTIPNTSGNVLELREDCLRSRSSDWIGNSPKGRCQYPSKCPGGEIPVLSDDLCGCYSILLETLVVGFPWLICCREH